MANVKSHTESWVKKIDNCSEWGYAGFGDENRTQFHTFSRRSAAKLTCDAVVLFFFSQGEENYGKKGTKDKREDRTVENILEGWANGSRFYIISQ